MITKWLGNWVKSTFLLILGRVFLILFPSILKAHPSSKETASGPASKVRFSQHPPISIPLEVPKWMKNRWKLETLILSYVNIHIWLIDGIVIVYTSRCWWFYESKMQIMYTIHIHTWIYRDFVALSESKHGNNNENHGDPAKVWLPVIYLKALGIPWTKQMDKQPQIKDYDSWWSCHMSTFWSIRNGFRMILVTNASTTLVKKIRPHPYRNCRVYWGDQPLKRYWNLRISHRKDLIRGTRAL